MLVFAGLSACDRELFGDKAGETCGAVLSAAAMTGVQLVNVHALGGRAMLEAAVQAISAGVPMGADRPRLLAVTLLTSMDHRAMKEVGIGGEPKVRVVKLAQLAKKSGVDGVVASVQAEYLTKGLWRRR
jgi:orotidine-5'-phosphate decarboxylase